MFLSCVQFLRYFHIAGAKIPIKPIAATPQNSDTILTELLLYYVMSQKQR